MKAGAVEFLTKPFREQDLLQAIQRGIEQNRITRKHNAEIRILQQRYASLTPREREVFPRVTSGLLNKQIAAHLGASEKTIKVHRGQVMQKMKAESLAHLIQMAEKLRLSSPLIPALWDQGPICRPECRRYCPFMANTSKASILLLVVTQGWPEAPPAVVWIRGHVTRWS